MKKYQFLVYAVVFVVTVFAGVYTVAPKIVSWQAQSCPVAGYFLCPSSDPAQEYALAVRYVNGRGVEQSDAKAVRFMQGAAEAGYARAQYDLGLFYYNGYGPLKQNYAQAAHWWSKAADQGFAQAQYNLGLLYFKGEGVEQSYKTAAGLWLKAGKQGVTKAQDAIKGMLPQGQDH